MISLNLRIVHFQKKSQIKMGRKNGLITHSADISVLEIYIHVETPSTNY